MKRLLLFLVTALMFSSCTAQLTEKVEAKFPNGQPKIVRFYNSSFSKSSISYLISLLQDGQLL